MPVIGALNTLLVALAAAALGQAVLKRWLVNLDPAAAFGVAGLLMLGSLSTATLLVGLIPTGLHWGVPVIALGTAILLGLIAIAAVFGNPRWVSLPKGLTLLFPITLLLAFLLALTGVLTPSTANDWDSIAYHLAVPKIWLHDGQIHPISWIHQSNFPGAIDNLYLWGLQWGDQSGAKAFSLAISTFGAFALFGLARQRYGGNAGWWAALAFASMPVVLWQSGTAYIDVGNGLYAGLGMLFAALWLENRLTSGDKQQGKNLLILTGLTLGLAAGTKYTGLQTIFVTAAVLAAATLIKEKNLAAIKGAAAATVIALAICSPWYIRNEIWKGNPVFPFFYSKLGGKDWDARRAAIYTHEQQTFGVGREPPAEHHDITENPLNPTRIGHSILGLAYQPGRYVNPYQTIGGGSPLGAIGPLAIATLMALLFGGRKRTFENSLMVMLVLSLGIWFVLTQQSRYIISLAVPLAVLFGGLAPSPAGGGPMNEVNRGEGDSGLSTGHRAQSTENRGEGVESEEESSDSGAKGTAGRHLQAPKAPSPQFAKLTGPRSKDSGHLPFTIYHLQLPGLCLATLCAAQTLYCLYLYQTALGAEQLRVALGTVAPDDYLKQNLPFYQAAQSINKLGPQSKTALYDEVFGFYLDVPYMWANPGHSTVIPYDDMKTGKDYANSMRKLGFTHVYLNLAVLRGSEQAAQQRKEILDAMGAQGAPIPFPAKERSRLMNDWQSRYSVLIPEAVATGDLQVQEVFPSPDRPKSMLLKIR